MLWKWLRATLRIRFVKGLVFTTYLLIHNAYCVNANHFVLLPWHLKKAWSACVEESWGSHWMIMKSNVAHLQAIHRLPNVLPIRIHPQRKSESIAYHMKLFPPTKYFQNAHVALFTTCHVEQLGAESTLYITVDWAVQLYQTSTWPRVAVPDT